MCGPVNIISDITNSLEANIVPTFIIRPEVFGQ